MKKNGLSTETRERSAMTGQVTGHDKNGRESDKFPCPIKTSLIAGNY